MKNFKQLPKEIAERAHRVGIDEEKKRSGSYMLSNNSVLMESINKAFEGQIEILDTKEAMKKYSWLSGYRWKLVDKNKDEFTRAVAENYDGGYFIHVFENAKVTLPIQSCMMVSSSEFQQKVHNIIIVEKNADAKIIAGCTLHPKVGKAAHIGISEFFIREGAKLNFTMVHYWNEDTLVRPRSAALVEKNSHFTSNYVILNPVKDLQMYPAAKCEGENSRVSFNNLVFSTGNSLMDAGSKIELNGKNSKGEIISRIIAKDNSRIISRGMIIGNNASKAHLECKGLIMGNKSMIHAIPELISNTEDAELSHEAAVGKIAEKEITYLMSRGLTQEQAVSMIVRGFMDVKILGLPKELNSSIQHLMDKVAEGL